MEELDKVVVDFIEECLKDPKPEGQLIAVLHKAQEHYGYLSPEVLDCIAQLMQIPTAKVSGVASFYHYFRLKPRGKYIINVCQGTACYIKGSEVVANRFREELGIEYGETTTDNMFTLEATRCLGACALAPVVKIGDDMHARVRPDDVPNILQSYIDKE
jgi:NADH:ubiquinone oxidoreductase subunit E